MEKLYPSGHFATVFRTWRGEGGEGEPGVGRTGRQAGRNGHPAEKVYDKHRGYWQLHDQYIIPRRAPGRVHYRSVRGAYRASF